MAVGVTTLNGTDKIEEADTWTTDDDSGILRVYKGRTMANSELLVTYNREQWIKAAKLGVTHISETPDPAVY